MSKNKNVVVAYNEKVLWPNWNEMSNDVRIGIKDHLVDLLEFFDMKVRIINSSGEIRDLTCFRDQFKEDNKDLDGSDLLRVLIIPPNSKLVEWRSFKMSRVISFDFAY